MTLPFIKEEAAMRILPLMILSLLLSACTPHPVTAPDPAKVSPGVTPTQVDIPLDSTVDTITRLAIQDLSNQLLVDSAAVSVLSVESIVWSDASLRCPRAGETNVQKTVPGYRLHLEVDGTEYVYHTDTTQNVILCTDEKTPFFHATPDEIDDGQPWMPVN